MVKMKNTQRVQSRKNNSWWWDSHISQQNSKWLSENLEEMEKHVKEMLGFIEEEEGEFSAEKAEAYYQKRPLLITHVKTFYGMYRALAERYDSVTGELRKNIPSSLQSHGSGVSFDVSKKGSEGSSSSSEYDSGHDDIKEENINFLYALSQKIMELEDELCEARGKLIALEEKDMHCQYDFDSGLKVSEHEEKLQSSDMESNNFQNDLEERATLESWTEVNGENEALESMLTEHKNEIEVLKGAMASSAKQFEVELTRRDLEVDKCKHELIVLSEKYLHDKSVLEAELGKLQGAIKNLEGDITKISMQKLQLESRIEELEQEAHNVGSSASEIVKLQEVIRTSQAKLEKVTKEHKVLKEQTTEFKQLCGEFDVSGRDLAETIKNLKAQLERALEEKSILQFRIKELEQITHDSLEKHSQEQSSLSADFLKVCEMNASLQRKLSSVEAELMRLYDDKEEEFINSEKRVSVLNQDLANLKSELALLSCEKASVDDKLANLQIGNTTRDAKIKQMDDHLNQLQLEHAKVMAEAEVTCNFLSELRARVSELEEEVEKKKLVILESAEGKREAIRQLCFSLEHYRREYQQLRQLLHGHKRPLMMAT